MRRRGLLVVALADWYDWVMTATWVTFAVAVLTAVVGFVGVVTGQWLASNRAVQLETIKREGERADRNRQERRDAYVRFVVAARSIGPMARKSTRGVSDLVLAELREAGAELELANPGLWDEHAAPVVEAGQRWVSAAVREGPAGPAAREAEAAYGAAFSAVREQMKDDLGR
jgi:hypothetical protein